MPPEEIAIQLDGVSKDFRFSANRANTLKSLFTGVFQSKDAKEKTQHALRNITFDIKPGEFFGIVGRNGSGKSTLLKILAGIYQPNKGSVKVRGKIVPFIELGVGFNPELTGKENVYLNGALLNFSKKEIDAFYEEVVEFAELHKFMDKKLKNYSSGMQVRLAFSMAIRAKADVLLIDEVLAVGDADFQRKCFEYFKQLKKSKATVVFVSHDMGAIREFCDRAALVENSRLKDIGDPQSISQQYSQLFMNEIETASKKGDRWGNGDVRITNATSKLVGDDVLITANLDVKKDVERMIYGLHINAADGSEITAMNNKMLGLPFVENLKAGDSLTLTWKVQNIFNDGIYSATLTFVDDVANTLEWWVEATSFGVKRVQRSTTAILPPVAADVKINRK